eukprot:661267-Hanusia_phi.AAC.2
MEKDRRDMKASKIEKRQADADWQSAKEVITDFWKLRVVDPIEEITGNIPRLLVTCHLNGIQASNIACQVIRKTNITTKTVMMRMKWKTDRSRTS